MREGSGESPSFSDPSARRALERVELVSAAGVALAGAGLALLFADRLAPFTVLILSSGLVIHAIAMFGKRRIEHRANLPRERWMSSTGSAGSRSEVWGFSFSLDDKLRSPDGPGRVERGLPRAPGSG